MTNTTVKSKLVETLTEKVIEQIALNNPDYECGEQRATGILDNIYNVSLSNILVESEKIKEFTEKLKDSSISKDNKELYQKAIKVVESMITKDLLDSNEESFKKYDETNDIYECFNYFEYPLSVLGINSKNKDYNYSVFGVMALDITAFQNNKKHTWEEVKNDPISSKKFVEAYGELSENEDDLYFDCFKHLDSIEDKIAFVKEHFVLHSMGIGETKEIKENETFVLHGSLNEDTTAMDYREYPDKVSEILELDI